MVHDWDLLRSYDNGDKQAFDALVQRHIKSIYNFAFRMSGNEADAEDITQITFVNAWSKLHTFSRGTNFKSWLFAIAHNAAIDVLRKKRDIPVTFLENDEGPAIMNMLTDTEPMPDEITARAKDKKMLEKFLLELSIKDRELLLLYYHEHMTFAEISDMLSEPIDTIKSRHLRARHKLRGLFAKGAQE